MDLKSLKRKELQALCKKHGILANSSNSQLIESLSSILEDHDKAKPKGCLKGSGGSGAEDLGIVGGVSKKKVTFVVEDGGEEEFEEITGSPVGDSKGKVAGNERRSTRSGGLAEAVVWSPVIAKTKKKSLAVGMQGVRRNDKLISGEVQTTRSLRNRAVVVGVNEELASDETSRRIQGRRSIAEKKITTVTKEEEDHREEVEGITINPVANSKRKSVASDAVEIEGRSMRSRHSVEAVVSSPDIEKKKKGLSVGTEGVRQNVKPISNLVSTTRSLRNRVAVVGDEELATDQNSRRTQKRKVSDKKEENEMEASKMEEDEFVGKKNLRKRSRGGDFIGDEAADRRSSRSHTKSEEKVAVEEVDVGRSNKRRRKDTDGSIIEKGVDEDIERANRTKRMVAKSDATESRDVDNAGGQKKAQSQGKTRASKGGDATISTRDSEVVILPGRRSTRSAPLVGTSDEEVKAVKKGKLQKHVKDGEGSEFVSEPVRKSTRSSSTLREDESSLPVAGVEEVRTGRSLKQAKHHGSEGGDFTAEPIRRSTRSSSDVGKSDGDGQAIKKGRSQKGGLPDSKVVAKSVKKSKRTSSTLQEDEASFLVEKPVSVDEAVKKSKSQKQAKTRGSKGGSSTISLRDSETAVEPVRRSTHSSSSLLEDITSLPAVEVVKEVKSHKQGRAGRPSKAQAAPLSPLSDNEATHTRRSTRSSKSLEDDADLSTRRSTRGSSKLLEDGSFLEAVSKDKPGKKSRSSASKDGGSRVLVSDSPVVSESIRGSTRSSMEHISLEVETSLPVSAKLDDEVCARSMENYVPSNVVEGVIGKIDRSAPDGSAPRHSGSNEILLSTGDNSGDEAEKVGRKTPEQREDDLEGQISEAFVSNFKTESQTKALEEHEQFKALPKGSVQSASNKNVLAGDKDEDSKSDGAIPVSGPPIADVSVDLSIDAESGKAEAEFNDTDDKNAPEIRKSLAEVEKGTSLVGSAKDLDDEINGNQSSVFELASEGSGASLVNVEGSSEIEENVSRQLGFSDVVPIEPSSTVEVDTQLTSESASTPSKVSKELSTFDTEISTMALPTEPEPDSMVEVGIEHEDIISGYEAVHGSSSQLPRSSEELSLRTDSRDSFQIDLEEPRLEAEIRCANEDGLEYDGETDMAVPTLVCKSSEELTLAAVTGADPEIDIKEPDSKAEDDSPREDVVPDNDAVNIFDPTTSVTKVYSDSRASRGTEIEEPRLKMEICGANEDGLDDNEETDIMVRTSVCESSEELTLTSVSVANPEADLEEPDSKVEVDCPIEDILGDAESKKIFDPTISGAEICLDSLTSCGTDLEEPRLEAEICGANEDGLDDNEETDIVVQTSVCESSKLTSTSVTVANPEIDLKEPDSKVEVDRPSEDIVGDNEAKTIDDPTISDAEICLDSVTSRGTDLEEPRLETEICGADEDGLDDNEETDIVVRTSVCESSEELTLTPVTVANPEIELKDLDSKVEVDRPSEDIVGDDEAKTIFDPMTSDTEVYSHSPTSRGTDLEEPRLEAEIVGANEDGLQDDEETDIVVQTSVCKSSEELTLTSVTVDNPVIDLKEPDSKVEIDHLSEDIVEDDEAKKIFDPMASDIEFCSDSRTSCGTDLEEAGLKAEIYGADEDIQDDEESDEDSLQDNEGTDIVVQTSVCKSSELTLTSVTLANPDFDLKEPYSEVEVDRPSEDIEGDNEAKKISDPLTSDTEFCAEPLCDINVEGSDFKVEVHHASKGDMEENEATTSVSSVMPCKSTGILSPTSLNEASYNSDPKQVDTPATSKEELLIEASSIHCKTLEASVTVDINPGDTSSAKKKIDNEMENFKANPDTILNSHLEHGDCDIAKKIEAIACEEDPQLYEEDMEVSKETWVTSMVSVTVNDGIIEDDSKDVEKNEDELRSSSPRESQPVQQTQSSPEELEDAEQTDFTQSLYDKEPADAEGKLTLEHKDEPFAFEIADISPEITEGKYSVDHRSSTQLLDASSKSVKQMEKDYEHCDADEGSNGCSASSNENTSPTDALLFGDAKKVVEREAFPTPPVTFTCGEEILPTSSTEAPTLLGNEGSAMQVDVRDFAYVHDNDDGRNVSDPQEVTVNATENLAVDFVDRSSKSSAKEHVDVEQLNSNSDALPETSITVNKLTDVEFERNIEFGGVVSEEMDDMGSWECEANAGGYDGTEEAEGYDGTEEAEGYDGTEEDSIESDKVDHLDDVDQKQDDAFLFHEIKCFSGELHTDENASHTSVNNSASGSAEQRVWLQEKVSSSTCMGNAPSSPKMDIVLPREEQLDKDCSEKASAENSAPNSEEFLSTVNVIPLASQQECQDANLEEHAVDDHISMDQYFEVEDEQSNKFQGTFGSFFADTFESFEHASNADEDFEEFSEIDGMKMLAIGDDDMKGVVSGSSVAVIEEASLYEREMSSKAENLSDTYSTQQSEDWGDGRTSLQQAIGEPKLEESLAPKRVVDCSSSEIDVKEEQNRQNTHDDQIEDGSGRAQNTSYYRKL